MIKQALNYLKALPARIVYYKLTAVEAIVFTVILMISATVVVYLIDPRPFAN
jgi:hypothetical protein